MCSEVISKVVAIHRNKRLKKKKKLKVKVWTIQGRHYSTCYSRYFAKISEIISSPKIPHANVQGFKPSGRMQQQMTPQCS